MCKNIFNFLIFILFVFSILSAGFSVVSISSCQYINESFLDSSRSVELSSDLDFSSGSRCIHFNASNVNLDCKGYEISGSANGQGIYAENYFNNLTIGNCNLIGKSFYVPRTSNSNIFNINVTNEDFEAYNSYTADLGNNTFNNIRVVGGRLTFGGKNITASNLFVTNSTSYGYSDSAIYSTIVNLTSVNNFANGYTNVRSGSGNSYNVYRNINVSNNGGYGIYNQYARGNKFYNVVGNNNDDKGFYLYKSSSTELKNSSFNNNVGWDVLIDPEIWDGHCGHIVSNVTVTGGGFVEYYKSSSGLTIENKNLGALIFCNVDSSTITNITISGGEGLNGIFIKYSDSNVFDKINSSNNYVGLSQESSNFGTITNSILKNNYLNDFDFVPFLSNNHNYNYAGNVCVQTLINITATGDLPIGFYTGSSTISDSSFNQLIFCNSDSISVSNMDIGVVDGIKSGGLYIYNLENSNFSNINVTDSNIGMYSHYSDKNIFNNLNFYNNYKGLYTYANTNVTFKNSTFKNTSYDNLIYYDRYSEDNIFKNNYFESGSLYTFEIYYNSVSGLLHNNIFNSTNPYSNRYYFDDLTFNITKTLEKNIVGGTYLGGNYWANPVGTGFSQTCVDEDKDAICDSSFVDSTSIFDELPLTNPYTMFIGDSPECYYNSSWQSCTILNFSDNLEQVRNSCVSNVGSSISGMTVSLKNIDDNKYYFENSAMSFSSGNYTLGSINSLINDSGDFVFEFKCEDVLTNEIQFDSEFSVDYGDILVELLTPSSNVSVLQNSTFSFSSRVTCLNRECGDLIFSLDPINESNVVYTKIVVNNSNSYNLNSCNTLCTPTDSDEGFCTISDLGFDFTLYNTSIASGTDVYVTTNGRIKLNSNTDYSVSGSEFESELIIAAMWTDYNGDNIYICPNQGISPNKYTSVVFDGSEYSYGTQIDNEIILHESGNIEFNFGTIGDNYYLGASGISNDYSFNYDLFPYWNLLENANVIYSPSGKGGLVPMDLGTPFFTTSQNPVNKSSLPCLDSMFSGDSCTTSWDVNATGEINTSYEMFTYVTGLGGKVVSPSIYVNISTITNLKQAYFIEPVESLVQTVNNWSFINVSSNLVISNCWLNWSGVLEPMSSSSESCYINKSELSDSLINYNVVVDIGSENLSTVVQQFDFVDFIIVDNSEPIGTSIAALPGVGFISLVVIFVSSLLFLI
jgi:hypothetical protein